MPFWFSRRIAGSIFENFTLPLETHIHAETRHSLFRWASRMREECCFFAITVAISSSRAECGSTATSVAFARTPSLLSGEEMTVRQPFSSASGGQLADQSVHITDSTM